jgi:Flp pilus assembly pilin Flp
MLSLKRLARDQQGQAMVEYSTITLGMLAFSAGFSLVWFGPMFMNALNIYLDGIYFVVNAALP